MGNNNGGASPKPHRVSGTEPLCRYCDVLPRTAKIVAALLIKEGYGWLAKEVPDLMIFDCCSCAAPECASFYTQPRPEGRFGPTHWGFMLPCPDGLMVFDIVGDTIAFIEILDFPLATAELARNWNKFHTRQDRRRGDSAESSPQRRRSPSR